MISDHYITLAEAAAIKGVSTVTIWRWIRAGRIPGEKVGREVLIRKDDLVQIERSQRGRKRKE